jgi:hypothetical protein
MEFQDKNVFHSYLLKLWIDAIASGSIQTAIEIEFQHYNQLVKPYEDITLWDKWQSDTFALRAVTTWGFDQKLPLRSTNTKSNKFLIVHHNYSGLAHEVQLSRNINFLRNKGATVGFEVAYLFGGSQLEQNAAAELYQIPLSSVRFIKAVSYLDAGKKLNSLTTNYNYNTIIYPSIFIMAYWMSLFVSHGNQKFLQMKYFPLHSGRLSEWGCGRKNTNKKLDINGFTFTQLSVLNPSQASNNLPKNQLGNFKGIQNFVTFGSISRPDKVTDLTYNQFVLDMLEQNPWTKYLFTGREEDLSRIPLPVRTHTRSLSMGWVDPAAVIRNYHIYLESFPWGGGDMTLLALENGIPYLILDTPVNRLVGIFNFLEVIAQSAPELVQFSFCDNITTMTSRFSELASSEELRQSLGSTWARTIHNYQPTDVDAWLSFLGC